MKNKYLYPAIFTRETSGYVVEFPDLEGCMTEGNTLEESFEMAKDALSLYIFDLLEENKEVPEPSNSEKINNDNKNSFVSIVEFDLIEYREKYNNKPAK